MIEKPKNKSERVRNVIVILGLIFVCVYLFAAFVQFERNDYATREAQKASGNFSGYISDIEPIMQDGTTISVSVTFKVAGTDSEIIVLGPEFSSLSEYTTLVLTGCQKNTKGFWENCQVDIR